MHAQHAAGSSTSSALPDTDTSAQRHAGGHRRTTSFRSRRSALSDAQRQTWERLWPELGIAARGAGGVERNDPGSGDSPASGGLPDTRAWFSRDAPVVLEIGCGAGTSTLAMAQVEPDVDVVAVDVYRRGLAQLLCAIERENVDNIRLIRGDAVDVLQHMVEPNSLTGVRVFFPDPWPKARHHKRRVLQPVTIALIADRLRPGGVLHAATDHGGYAEQIAETGDAESRLSRVGPACQGLPISVVRPTTKYETKARHAGRAVTELLWEKRES